MRRWLSIVAGHAGDTRAWRWLLALAMFTLLVLSLVPAETPLPSTGWDKTNHLLGFATLAFLGQHAFARRTFATLCGLFAYGALIEMLQSFTPDRAAEFGDLLADGFGLLGGWAATHVIAALEPRLRDGTGRKGQ